MKVFCCLSLSTLRQHAAQGGSRVDSAYTRMREGSKKPVRLAKFRILPGAKGQNLQSWRAHTLATDGAKRAFVRLYPDCPGCASLFRTLGSPKSRVGHV